MPARRLVVSIVAVLLAVSAASVAPAKGRATGRCSIGQLAVAAHVEGIAGALVPTIDVWNISSSPCVFDRRVYLAVRSRTGRLLTVHGNPAHHRFDRLLRPGRGVSGGFGWRNWCKAGTRNRYVFRLGSRSLLLRARGRPSCNSPGNPSRLRFEGSGRLS